jgi:2-methylfumaryl-CoA isomerase
VFDGGHFPGEPAPRLGGDTADVLTASLGLTAADITRLTDAKTIAR